MAALLETNLRGLPKKRGKVRDVYDLGSHLLMIATDRISAFDRVLPVGIPDKGRVLTGLSTFWFERIPVRNHLLSADVADIPIDLTPRERAELAGRIMLVRKAKVVPFECVVRGYLSGSGWKEYRASGTVCGEPLPPGLAESARIPTLFTPATKAEAGHDQNVPFAYMVEQVGQDLAETLRRESMRIYEDARAYAGDRGLILADTKFEWGQDEDGLLLVDEVLTPDSSRYWPSDPYRPGGPQPSFDKQYVRDWLEESGWDKSSPPPALPDAVVARTRAKYIQAYESLTGRPSPWT